MEPCFFGWILPNAVFFKGGFPRPAFLAPISRNAKGPTPRPRAQLLEIKKLLVERFEAINSPPGWHARKPPLVLVSSRLPTGRKTTSSPPLGNKNGDAGAILGEQGNDSCVAHAVDMLLGGHVSEEADRASEEFDARRMAF